MSDSSKCQARSAWNAIVDDDGRIIELVDVMDLSVAAIGNVKGKSGVRASSLESLPPAVLRVVSHWPNTVSPLGGTIATVGRSDREFLGHASLTEQLWGPGVAGTPEGPSE